MKKKEKENVNIIKPNKKKIIIISLIIFWILILVADKIINDKIFVPKNIKESDISYNVLSDWKKEKYKNRNYNWKITKDNNKDSIFIEIGDSKYKENDYEKAVENIKKDSKNQNIEITSYLLKDKYSTINIKSIEDNISIDMYYIIKNNAYVLIEAIDDKKTSNVNEVLEEILNTFEWK